MKQEALAAPAACIATFLCPSDTDMTRDCKEPHEIYNCCMGKCQQCMAENHLRFLLDIWKLKQY